MYNTYTSSALWPIRSKRSSLSCSFNDYSNSVNERSDRNPFLSSSLRCCCTRSSSCCSCSLSSFASERVPIRPRFLLYGLRQSTLIQWSPCRRTLILGGGDRFFNRFLGYDLDGECPEVSCSIRERYYGSRSIGRRGKEKFRFGVSEESGECCGLSGLDDAEAVIALLSEEVNEECLCGRERNEISVDRVEERKRGRYGSECYSGNKRRVEVERRANHKNERLTGKGKSGEVERRVGFVSEQYMGNEKREGVKRREKYDSEHYGGRKKDFGLESDSRGQYKSVTIGSRGEGSRRNEEREAQSRRTKTSGCSSYYSLSSSGEFESNIDNRNEGMRFDLDTRKKTEKRVIQVSAKESESSKESSQMQSRRRIRESDYGVSAIYQEQPNDEEEKSLAVNLDQRRQKRYSQTGDSQSDLRRIYEEDTDKHEIHVNDVEINSQSQNHFSGRRESTVVSFGSDVDRENIRKRPQQLNKRSDIQYTGDQRISQMQRESRYRNIREEDANLTCNSVQEISEQQQQTEEMMIRQANLRGKTECLSERSEICDTDISSTSISQSESQIRKREESTSLVSGSRLEVKEQDFNTDQIPLRRIQTSKGSASVSHTSDVTKARESKKTSEKRIIGQESIVTLVVQPGKETKQTRDQTDTRAIQTNFRREAQKPYEKAFGEASGSQSYLTSTSGNRIQQVNLEEEVMRESQSILMPPPSQLVNRASRVDYQTGETVNQEVSYQTSQSGFDALCTTSERRPLISSSESYDEDRRDVVPGELLSLEIQEDALGSAHRSEQSSMQLIGDFVEKARHEASTSETQKEERSESFQLQRRDSRQSSRASGARGPSDEMWVTNPYARETLEERPPEDTEAAGNAIVKRSSRSLWTVISDVVRLRWGLRAGTSDPAAKSAGKSSPNESVSGERWFSGRENDGSSDDNAKRERRTVPQEAESSHQLKAAQTSSHVESSWSTKLNEELGQHEVDLSSSSNRLEGGSESRRISSVSGDQSVGFNEYGRSSQGLVSETDVVEGPLQLPAQRSLRRSPAVKELPESSPTEVSGSSSLREQVDQQHQSARSHEETGSPAEDSVLKQRKLQRNKQVVRDRFDEWEEAYRREAEQRKIDEMFMREALLEAKKAADIWEVPVGAVLVHDGKIIARGCNLVEELRDSTAHAEMICIREGSNVLRSWRLADTTLYVTLEPCPMCAGAILQARIKTLVWGAPNKLLGADGSWIKLFPGEGNGSEPSDKPPAPIHPFHPKMTISRGVLKSECAQVMQQFFQLRRKKKDKNPDKNKEPPTPPSRPPVSHHHPSKILNRMHDIFHIMFCL